MHLDVLPVNNELHSTNFSGIHSDFMWSGPPNIVCAVTARAPRSHIVDGLNSIALRVASWKESPSRGEGIRNRTFFDNHQADTT